MTTGNDPYMEHLRGQLTAVLDDITPPAAPIAAVKRRGKVMRNRRRVGIAAGLGVAVVAAVLLPGLLRQSDASRPITPQHKNPRITVQPVGRGAPHGLVAQGAIAGKRWRITLSWQGKRLCVNTSGDLPLAGCASPRDYAATWPATLEGTGTASTEALYGIVAYQVSRIRLTLSDDVVLNLHPVRFGGRRWIALELPAQLAVTKVVAFSQSGELAYAIPFTAVRGGLPSIETWLRAGKPAPRKFVRLIGSGVSAGKRWSVAIHVGPWGQCAIPDIPGDSRNVSCWPGSTRQPGVITGSGDPANGRWWVLGAVRPKVSYLTLSMTDGSTRHVPAVQVGNLRLYAIAIIGGPRIAHWAAYDASGHRLYGGQGSPDFGHR